MVFVCTALGKGGVKIFIPRIGGDATARVYALSMPQRFAILVKGQWMKPTLQSAYAVQCLVPFSACFTNTKILKKLSRQGAVATPVP